MDRRPPTAGGPRPPPLPPSSRGRLPIPPPPPGGGSSLPRPPLPPGAFKSSLPQPPLPPQPAQPHKPPQPQPHPHHRGHHRSGAPPPKWHSFKLLVDPQIHKDAKVKTVRYDGHFVPNNPHYVPPQPSDPRKKLPKSLLWRRLEMMDLPVPKMKVDEYYVGEPPKVEVTFENLNDNVDAPFLNKMAVKYGVVEDLNIAYHPLTKKHLGLARVVYEEVKSARDCVNGLHGKSVMGKKLNCYLDPKLASFKKMFEEMTEEKKPEPPQEEVKEEEEEKAEEASPKDKRRGDPRHSRQRSTDSGRRRDSNTSRRESTTNEEETPWANGPGKVPLPPPPPLPPQTTVPAAHDPQYGQPDYWMTAAQRYAEQVQSENAESDKTSEAKEISDTNGLPNDEAEDDRQVDLDTRLKMLMKDKSGAMPAFLLDELGGSEEDDEEKKKQDALEEAAADAEVAAVTLRQQREDPTNAFIPAELFPLQPAELPLSRAPSPFLSTEIYLKSHSFWLTEKRHRAARRQRKRRTDSRNSDQMSLSSLSSGENNIYEQPRQTFLPPMQQHYFTQPPWPDQPMYDANGQYVGGFHPPPPGGFYDPYWQHHHAMMQQEEQQQIKTMTKKDVHNAIRFVVKESTDTFVKDLKRTLRKDMNKRICETFAFILFDKWWTEQETKYKNRAARHQSRSSSSSSKARDSSKPSDTNQVPTDSKTENNNKEESSSRLQPSSIDAVSSIFDKQREKFAASSGGKTSGGVGGLGFGFRGTIPKIPSFKKKSQSSKSDYDRRKRRDASSEDDRRRDRRSNDRRKDHERRRDRRREERKDEERRLEKSKEKPKEKEEKKSGRTLDSIYNTLYSDDDRLSSDGAKKKLPAQPSTKVEDHRKKKRRSSLSSLSSRSSSSSSESDDDDDAATKPQKASDSSSGRSSPLSESALSSSEDEEEAKGSSSDEEVKPKGKTKTSIKKPSKKLDPWETESEEEKETSEEEEEEVEEEYQRPSSSSNSSSSEQEEEESSNEEEEVTVDDTKKPVPMRRAGETKAEENGHALPDHMSDHCYALRPDQESEGEQAETVIVAKPAIKRKAERSVLVPRLLPQRTFKPRTQEEQQGINYRFLGTGLDLEDLEYLKQSYQMMLNSESKDSMVWVNDTHWVDHPVTAQPDPPRKKRRDDYSRPHLTGSCRTEGYYKMDPREKARTKYHLLRSGTDSFADLGVKDAKRVPTAQNVSREARSAQRRQLAVLGEEAVHSDLLRFNQLKFRRKAMIFGKSAIHDWGLFALEDIGADEMVIEYVGHVIRPVLSDVWEKKYEKQGIGSSYLFRIDSDYVVDATKRGNLARFINHSCDPNCYAKVITVDAEKKIVIYSKQPIATGEEITYDYKFPIEDEKIRCLCASKNCRKYLN